MRHVSMAVLLLISTGGCTSFQQCACSTTESRGPKTLLEWTLFPEKDEDKAENGDRPNGTKPEESNKDEGNGKDKPADKSESTDPRSEPLISDRPDFTEASTTVGKGVIQFEGGYTYSRDRDGGTSVGSHSYPQSLFRIGLFADWFELRVGQNYSSTHISGDIDERVRGFEDTYLGVKLALTEQQKVLPETALIIQATVPTGQSDLTSDRTLPGINFLFSWELIKDKLDLGGSLQANKTIEDGQHSYLEIAQSFSFGYTLTEKLGAYTEWYAFYPSGALSPQIGPQYYFDGGFTYKFTNNIQFDVNAGVGLNRLADDYFIGSGIVLRF